MTVRETPLALGDGHFVVPGNRWDLLDGRDPGEPPFVSVVIPYFDGQRRLDRMLSALAAQTHPLQRLQVVVADDGSPSAPIVRAHPGLVVEVVSQRNKGFRAAAARNLGAAAADGEVLCFLDDDTLPTAQYVAAIARLPALLPDAVVTGRRRHVDLSGLDDAQVARWLAGQSADAAALSEPFELPEPPELPEPQWLRDEHRATGNLLRIGPLSHRYVISAVMACHRRLFDEIGGFDGDFAQYGGEDWEFAHRAQCAGTVLAHVPAAVAWHDGPSWAERGDPESRRTQQNAETAALAELIPPPRGRGAAWTARPNVTVEIDTDDAEPGAAIVAVRSVLAGDVDAGVWLPGATGPSIVERYFAADPRVRPGRPDRPTRAAARARLTCTRPLRIAPNAWTPLLERLYDGAGQIVVDTGDGQFVLTASGAAARSRRWDAVAGSGDLLGELFGRVDLDAAEAGVYALPRRPNLAHELKHLLDP